jgi:hypothetical protein
VRQLDPGPQPGCPGRQQRDQAVRAGRPRQPRQDAPGAGLLTGGVGADDDDRGGTGSNQALGHASNDPTAQATATVAGHAHERVAGGSHVTEQRVPGVPGQHHVDVALEFGHVDRQRDDLGTEPLRHRVRERQGLAADRRAIHRHYHGPRNRATGAGGERLGHVGDPTAAVPVREREHPTGG